MTVCASCGTEVDEDAIFCPTCGQPIRAGAQPELPPAPDWPAPPPRPGEPMTADRQVDAEMGSPASGATGQEPSLVAPAAPREEPAPAESAAAAEPSPMTPTPDPRTPPSREALAEVPPWRRGVAFRPTPLPPPDAATPPPAPPPADEATPSWRATPTAAVSPADVAAPTPRPRATADPFGPAGIIAMPETIAGWLMTIGALVGVLAILLPWREGFGYTASWGLASGMNILVVIALLAVLVVLLAPHLVPAIPHRDLAIAAIGLVGVGIGLDRLGLPLTGMGATVFLIAMILVAGGGLIAVLGLDRPTGGVRR